jgi:PAS domain S-box-containing protein
MITANPYVIIIALDNSGNTTSFNERAEEVAGYTSSSILKQNLLETFSFEEKYPYILNKFEEWQQGRVKLLLSFENIIYTKSEEERFIAWHINEMRQPPVGKKKGQCVFEAAGIICCGIDITELKKYEKEISLQNQKLLTLKNISEIVLNAQTIAGQSTSLMSDN